MDECQNQAREVERLRARLDEMAARQAEEVAELRRELRALERRELPQEAEAPVPAKPWKRESAEAPAPPASPPEPPPLPETKRPDEQPVTEVVAQAPRKDRNRNLEIDFGKVWLVRIGVVLLVTGLVLLGNYAYRNWIRDLPAGVRLAFLVASSVGLAGAGWWCAARERTRTFGEVLLAGGMAFFYWCAYAAHHVSRLRVIDSGVGGMVAVLVAAAAIVIVSVKRNARTTAVMGLLLAAYSTVLQPMDGLTAGSNIVLAATGVALTIWKRWSAPGPAAMVGVYGAYLYWHLGGAVGPGLASGSLVFPALVWAIFALPTLRRHGIPGFSEYGRAWWTGLNNGAGLGLFALTWWQLGRPELWFVVAVWGVVWLGIGIWVRMRSRGTPTYLVQGIAALTMAMVLKLDGYHLALGLAVESLLMAGAWRRFAKWPELFISPLAAIGAVGFILEAPDAPQWVRVAVAVVVSAASWLLRRAPEKSPWRADARVFAGLTVFCAAAAGYCWWERLPVDWRPPVAAALALGLGFAVHDETRRRELVEVFVVMLLWGVAVLLSIMPMEAREPSLWLAAGLSSAAGCLWERRGCGEVPNGYQLPSIAAWLHAATGVVAAVSAIAMHEDLMPRFGMELGLGIGLPLGAWYALRSPRLRAASCLFLVVLCIDLAFSNEGHAWLRFVPPLAAWLVWRLGGWSVSLSAPGAAVFSVLTRGVGAFGWMLAWHEVSGRWWSDVLALSTLGGWLLCRRLKHVRRTPELYLWGFFAAAGTMADAAGAGVHGLPSGWGATLALIAAVFLSGPSKWRPLVGWGAVVVSTAWASQWLAGNEGWNAVTILWTVSGFAWVCVGLWRRFAAVRVAGFMLLLLSLLKLFIHDVWQFETFVRVAAFLALGVALIVLGFFYNRFADILRKLMQDETAAPLPGEETP